MKKILFLPILVGLISPLALIAEEYKTCLELGKRECAIKQLVIGTCASFVLENDGRSDREISKGSMYVYKKYGEDVGFSPNEKERKGKENRTEAELDAEASLVKARIMSLCPNAFNKFAAKSYIKLREKILKEKKSFNTTYDQYLKNLPWMEYLMFEMRVGLWEILAEKQKQK